MDIGLIRAHGLPAAKADFAVNRFAQEDLPSIQTSPGFVAQSIAVNHAGGSALSLTFWESAHHRREGEQHLADARERARADFAPPEPFLVDAFEVDYFQGDDVEAATWLRLVRFTGLGPTTLRRALESYRDDSDRHLEETRGVEGILMGTAVEGGSLVVISFWDTLQAMREAAQLSAQIRAKTSTAVRLALTPLVDHFEIALAVGLDRLGAEDRIAATA